MPPILDLPPELQCIVVYNSNHRDIRALACTCWSLRHAWLEYAWKDIDAIAHHASALRTMLSHFAGVLKRNSKLGTYVHRLCIRARCRINYNDILPVDTDMGDIIAACPFLLEVVLDCPSKSDGTFCRTKQAIFKLLRLRTLSLGRFDLMLGNSEAPEQRLASRNLTELLVVWSDNVDFASLLEDQPALQRVHLELPSPTTRVLDPHGGWKELRHISMGINFDEDEDVGWMQWRKFVESALVSFF